ncbi:MAG TPA: ABC transporter substrate-binding protein, partial [Acetobacteraceae bacterium]|nr:ABC transporter substrate-binding protein [Acetobacteraceae bacterium]
MAEPVSRRTLLAAGGGVFALAALGEAPSARADAFDWKKHAGTKLRVVTLKFPLSEIQQARLADFEQLTGMKVQWEMLPEDLWRQKVKVEHLGGSTDLDVFLSYYGQEGDQFLASGWYTDTAPMIRNPALTNPDFAWDDYIPAVRNGATVKGQVPIIPDRAAALPILYYRRDLFQQFNLERPKTWDDVRNAAKT